MHRQYHSTDVFRTPQRSAVTKQNERCPPHVTWKHIWSAGEVQEALQESPFARLPVEVMLQIFRCLSVHDLGSVSLVCRAFKMSADSDEIWKPKCNSECLRIYISVSLSLSHTSIEFLHLFT